MLKILKCKERLKIGKDKEQKKGIKKGGKYGRNGEKTK